MLRSVLLALALSGCSFVLVSGPPANHRELPVVECTTSKLGPILDTVWTGLQALNLLTALTSSDKEWDEAFMGDAPLDRKVAIPMYAAFGAIGAAGMYYGFTRTSRCGKAKAELAQRASGAPVPTQPGVGTWPPPPTAPGATPGAPAPAQPMAPTAPGAPGPAPAPAPAPPP